MIELVYPSNQVPVIPALRSYMAEERKGSAEEMLPVVEPSGLVVAQTSRSYAHSGEKPLHPVVHLHIINRNGEIYIQKRSMHKDLLPGRWDTAVGGHIGFGESVKEALFREAGEELGLTDFNPIFLDSYVFESEIEKELVCAFASVGQFDIHPDNDEVDEGRYWPAAEIENNLGKSVFTPNFESEFIKFRHTLEALL